MLLEKCRSETFHVPEYTSYYLEMFWRYQDKTGVTYHREEDMLPVSTCSVRYQSKQYALLCNVATSPDFEGKGYAKTLVCHAANTLLRTGQIPLIQARIERAKHLYKSVGFTKVHLGAQMEKG